jgi:hypothetical protein
MNKAPTKKSPLALFDLATGYQRAKVLFTLIELEIPTLLAKDKMTAEQLAKKLKIEVIATNRLLNSAVALGLCEKKDDIFRNAPISTSFLIKTAPDYLGEQFMRYNESSYPLWSDLTSKLREWKEGATDAADPEEDDQGDDAMAAQHNYALLVGRELGKNFDFSHFSHLLDLGGGTGAMSIGICHEHSRLSATIFDLPQVARVARKFVKQSELSERVNVKTGNFKEDDLPAGFDVCLLANLLSVASEATNRALLKKIYEKLPTGGAIILSGWILDDTRTSPLIPVLFCLEDIARAAPDVEHTAATYTSWLKDAGFKQIRRKPFFKPSSMIIGRKT